MPADVAGHGAPRKAPPGTARGRGSHRDGAAARAGEITRPAAPARPPPRPRPARITHRPSHGICDGGRQMPPPDVSSAMPVAGDYIAPGPGMMPDPAGDPGTVPSAWSLTITCASAMTDRDEQFVII